ncbi:MAG: lipopolysaccharide biosynthesis protein [Lautropia sp.]
MNRGQTVLLYGYFAQVYGTVLSIAVSPLILRAVGAETYGLVGLFLIAQAWFQLLDAGLTPALTRETARFRGGAATGRSLRDTLRGLEALVALLALPVLASFWLGSTPIATHWIRRDTLAIGEIVAALNFMGVILLLRWVSGIRRGVLGGFERHGTLQSVNVAVATLRFPGILWLFSWVAPSATSYFAWQLAISVLEAMALWLFSRPLLPRERAGRLAESLASLRTIGAFAANHAFLSLIWIVVTQTDKLILSSLLDLANFGYLSLAVAAAAGVQLIVMPISQVLMPKLARLHAEQDPAALLATYHRYTRLVVVFSCVTAAVFAAFGPAVMWAWTGDAKIVDAVGQVLAWYAVGNAALVIGAMSYYLQYANGNLRLHTIGTMAFLIVVVPWLFWAVSRFGMLGASVTWAAVCIAYLLTWVTVTHRQLLAGAHWRWLLDDVLRIVVPVVVVAIALARLVPMPDARVASALVLIACGCVLMLTALVASGLLQPWIKSVHTGRAS